VTVRPAPRFADLINADETLPEDAFVTPAAAPADAPAALKGTPEGARARGDSLDTLVPQDELARFGPPTPTRAGRLADASVDHTECRAPSVTGCHALASVNCYGFS